ncbi:MAG: hypothetical protein IIB43_08185 [Candidatus Marinimicrobia bacterium]|nr:hypothetical protein [Candidatus Neomarinimicrobiota bacterium]
MTTHSCLRTYLTRNEAEMDQALLRSCGFETIIQADDAGGMQPHLLFGNGGVRLLIHSSQADEAAQVLDATTTAE